MNNFLFKTSTLTHGNMSLRFGENRAVLQNRKQFLAENNITWEDHVCMRCSHATAIISVNWDTPLDENRMIDAEVLVTQEKGLTLMLLTADCLPTALYDPVTQTLALAHFSRQTIAENLPIKTIEYMVKHFGIQAEHIEVSVGPYIHTDSYRFPCTLENSSEAITPFVQTHEAYVAVDLLAAQNAQFISTGIKKENIAASSIDTATSSEHFSHYMHTRHGHPEGRIATIATMVS